MNNKELINELSSQSGFTQHDTRKMLNTFLDSLLTRVAADGVVQVPAFGTFELKKRVERLVTIGGKRMLVPPKLVMIFRPITAWKEQVRKGDDDE